MFFCDSLSINDRIVSNKSPVFIIAEIGVNHNGDISLAKEMASAAVEAGADAVKIQTFKADEIVTDMAQKAPYQIETTGKKSLKQSDMLRPLELSYDEHVELKRYCDKQKIILFSTPYGINDIKVLTDLGMPAIKIPSALIVEDLFLEEAAKSGLPLLISAGMASYSEIERALDVVKNAGNDKVILFQCTTNYPSELSEANLSVINRLREYLPLVGYSCHCLSHIPAVLSVAFGAVAVEKHFTLDKSMKGPDHCSSLTPDEFKDMVKAVRDAEKAVGSEDNKPSVGELRNRKAMRRSIVFSRDMKKGDIITLSDITFKRPAGGIPPGEYKNVVGKKLISNAKKDDMVLYSLIGT